MNWIGFFRVNQPPLLLERPKSTFRNGWGKLCSIVLSFSTRRRQKRLLKKFFSKYWLEAYISEVKIPYKLHSHKLLNQDRIGTYYRDQRWKWPGKIFVGVGARTCDLALQCCCERLFCLAFFRLIRDPAPWYSCWVVGLLEAVAIFVAGVRTWPVQESIHPNNTGPTAKLTASR